MESTAHATARKVLEAIETELKDTSIGYALTHNPDLPEKVLAVIESVIEKETA